MFKLDKVDILKLDIEGSEIETLKSVLNNKILPHLGSYFDFSSISFLDNLRNLSEKAILSYTDMWG